MDRVAFVLEPFAEGKYRSAYVHIRVNDTWLIDVVREAERPFADAAGNRRLAGQYAPLSLRNIGYDRGHFGQSPPDVEGDGDEDAVLLVCTCGEDTCASLTAHVDVTETTVRWGRFLSQNREWELPIGPYEFERGEYDAALEAIRW